MITIYNWNHPYQVHWEMSFLLTLKLRFFHQSFLIKSEFWLWWKEHLVFDNVIWHFNIFLIIIDIFFSPFLAHFLLCKIALFCFARCHSDISNRTVYTFFNLALFSEHYSFEELLPRRLFFLVITFLSQQYKILTKLSSMIVHDIVWMSWIILTKQLFIFNIRKWSQGHSQCHVLYFCNLLMAIVLELGIDMNKTFKQNC